MTENEKKTNRFFSGGKNGKGTEETGERAGSGIDMPGRRKWEAVEKTCCRSGHEMCELRKGKTQDVGRRTRRRRENEK